MESPIEVNSKIYLFHLLFGNKYVLVLNGDISIKECRLMSIKFYKNFCKKKSRSINRVSTKKFFYDNLILENGKTLTKKEILCKRK